MPNYNYGCSNEKCQYFFERQLRIDDRKLPLQEKCKVCKKKGTLEMLPAAPPIGDPIKLGVTRKPAWFVDRMQKIKEHHPLGNVKTHSSFN